ncbi:MAG: hypothetical protein IPN80_06970 [Flavobacterium sp.]|nr:hypothetical protein [Flavobacterium sp.]
MKNVIMKNSLLLFFVALGLFSSCVKDPEEDPTIFPPTGNFSVDFDGQTFESSSTDVAINGSSMSLIAIKDDGSYFRIVLPQDPTVGTYNWDILAENSEGFSLEYYDSQEAEPYVAAKDDEGLFASFQGYTDTAELVILEIDRTRKKVSGTFKFTGVRFVDEEQTTIETKIFRGGIFYDLPYATTPIVDPGSTNFLVKKSIKTDANNVISSTEYYYSGNKLNYTLDSDGTRTNYLYNENLLAQVNVFSGGTLKEKLTYEYDSSARLVKFVKVNIITRLGEKTSFTFNSDGTISYQNYSGTNLAQEELGTSGTISSSSCIENTVNPDTSELQVLSSEFSFDTKNNPFKNVIGIDKVHFAIGDLPLNFIGNITEQTKQIDDAEPSVFETRTYLYNILNYPTKVIHSNGLGELQYSVDYIYY